MKTRLIVFVLGALAISFLFGQTAFGGTPFSDDEIVPAKAVAAEPEKSAAKDSTETPTSLFRALGSKVKEGWSSIKKKVAGFFGSIGRYARQAGDFIKEVTNLPAWVKQGDLSKKNEAKLLSLAKAKPELAWPAGGDMKDARNAHRTNTVEEMTEALEGNYNWLECDVRLEGPLRDKISIGGNRRPITAHDSFQTNGMLFEDWVKIGKASGRGLKVEIKTGGALDQVLEILKKEGISQDKLILNIGIPDPGPAKGDSDSDLASKPVDDERLKKIRKDFPRAIINLSPGANETTPEGYYTSRQVEQMIRYSKAAGKPVMFPLKAEMVSPEIVKALKPYGKIAIWNDPSTFNPADPEAEIARFRSWGVDGMIDIRTQ